jgi:hypothetical protein
MPVARLPIADVQQELEAKAGGDCMSIPDSMLRGIRTLSGGYFNNLRVQVVCWGSQNCRTFTVQARKGGDAGRNRLSVVADPTPR